MGAGFNNARSRIGGKKWVVLSVVFDGNFYADLIAILSAAVLRCVTR